MTHNTQTFFRSAYVKYLDKLYRLLYRIAYSLKLNWNRIVRPEAYGVYIAVWVKHRVLIIKNSYKSCYTLPCGGIHKGETKVLAATRELSEEVSIHASPCTLNLAAQFVSHVEFMQDNISLYELCLDEIPEFSIDRREVVEADFKTIGEALKMDLFPVVREYLHNKSHIV